MPGKERTHRRATRPQSPCGQKMGLSRSPACFWRASDQVCNAVQPPALLRSCIIIVDHPLSHEGDHFPFPHALFLCCLLSVRHCGLRRHSICWWPPCRASWNVLTSVVEESPSCSQNSHLWSRKWVRYQSTCRRRLYCSAESNFRHCPAVVAASGTGQTNLRSEPEKLSVSDSYTGKLAAATYLGKIDHKSVHVQSV